MSAFIVSDDTIHAIVTFAADQKMMVKHPVTGLYHDVESFPDLIGQELVSENYRSVNVRYNETDKAPTWRHVPTRRGTVKPANPYEPLSAPIRRELTPLDIIKLCDCLEYQSCETDDWESTWTYAFLNSVRHRAITKLPGYDNAPWGLY